MPQLIALALIGTGLYAGYRWVARKMEDVQAVARQAEADARRRAAERAGHPRDLGTLEFDPASGEYKPKKG